MRQDPAAAVAVCLSPLRLLLPLFLTLVIMKKRSCGSLAVEPSAVQKLDVGKTREPGVVSVQSRGIRVLSSRAQGTDATRCTDYRYPASKLSGSGYSKHLFRFAASK